MMQRFRNSLFAVFMCTLLIPLCTTVACSDVPTHPTALTTTPTFDVNVPVDTDSVAHPEVMFLKPLGEHNTSRGPFLTKVTPKVIICRLADHQCSTDTIATLTMGHTAPGHDRLSLKRRSNTFTGRIPITAFTHDTLSAYRTIVYVDNDSIGFRDFKLTRRPRAYRADSSYAYVALGRTFTFQFRILPPPQTLTVVVEPGVHGSLVSGTYRYHTGERVRYHFSADAGYTNVLVMIDDDYVPTTGSLRMDHHHLLVVSADRRSMIPTRDAQLAHALRSLLHTPTATEAQHYLTTLTDLTDTANINERLHTIAQSVIDPIRDAAALKKLDHALAGHVLTAGTGYGSFTIDPPSGGGGGPIVMDKLAPLGTRSSQAAPPTTFRASVYRGQAPNEPVTIAYVNGIFTDPVYALNTAAQVTHLARNMRWPVDVPFEVRLIYNRSAVTNTKQSHATTSECFWKLARLVGTLGINSIPKFLATCSGKTVRNVIQHIDDLAEATQQYIQLTTNIGIPDHDAIMLADSTDRWRRDLQHVLFLPHSQGNLMVQQGIALLAQRGRYNPARDHTCIGAVSLAAPLSTHWPISDKHLRGVVVDGDAILALGTNHFPHVHTALSDSADADVEHWEHLGSTLKAVTQRVIWSIRLHDVVNSYFNQPASRAAIEQAIGFTYGSCAIGKIVAFPRSFLMHIGDSHTFTTTLFDINGHILDGTRPLFWFITGTSINLLPAIVSQTGTVAADTFGTAGIGVTATTRTDYVGVRVIPN